MRFWFRRQTIFVALSVNVANNPSQNQGGNVMCQIFAGQDLTTYEYETRSLRLNGQSTSIRLEAAFWDELSRIAEVEGVSTPQFISKLHSEVLELHGEAHNFTSLLRCACLVHLNRAVRAAPAARLAAE
jgi:predicted DNA-binding ribbon-helix-helix protein